MSYYADLIRLRVEDENSPDSIFFKGLSCAMGINCVRDKQKAIEIYQKGVEQGNPKCKYGLGILLLKSDPQKALSLFEDAFCDLLKEAEKADAFSQRMVSCYYYFGDRGVQKDMPQALFWLEKSVALGNPEAEFDLGTCYEHGDGVLTNLEKAYELYTKSAASGFEKANIAISSLSKKMKGELT